MPERRVLQQDLAFHFNMFAFMRKVVVHRAPQARMRDVVRRAGDYRHIAARQLVLPLRAGFDAREPCAIAQSIA